MSVVIDKLREDQESQGPELLLKPTKKVAPWRVAWRNSVWLRSVICGGAAVAAIVFCVLRIVAPPELVPELFSFDPAATWITKPDSRQSMACFRLDLDIPGKIANAWMAIASNGGYEVLSNGNQTAHFYLLSPTHPFQKGLSELGQRLNPGAPAIAVNFPREYQWHHHDNAELPTKVDLTPDLHPGHNALCVQVETNGTQPAMILSGEVQLATGERIPIRSDAGWRVESVPKTEPQDHWTLPSFPIDDWQHAETLSWKRLFWTLVPNGIYETPFTGQMLRPPLTDSVTWVEKEFNLSQHPDRGFLRIVADTPYQIWINGQYVRPPIRADGVLPYGPWFLREVVRSPIDFTLEGLPESLDPNDVGTLLPGQQKEIPLTRDPTINTFTPDQQKDVGTSNRPYAPNELPTPNSAQDGPPRGTTPYANPQSPERTFSPNLTRDRRSVEFSCYGITQLLRPGRNTIRIGLYKRDFAVFSKSQQPFIAFDGAATYADGKGARFASDDGVQCYQTDPVSHQQVSLRSMVGETIEPHLLPSKTIFEHLSPDRPWGFVSLVTFFVAAGLILIGTRMSGRLDYLFERGQLACGILAGWVFGGVILRSAMLERSDALYWRFPMVWAVLLVVGIIGAVVALILQNQIDQRGPLYNLVERRAYHWRWWTLFALTITACFALRAWQIDVQPPDADEYTSLQAVLSITKKGVPEYQPGIWYTRSALYHYLAAGVALATGGNIYTLRLLSVLFACGTAALVWKMTRELTQSRFFAFAAAILFSFEPYLVFTGHVARFYQQHQFFNLLGVYFLLRGFVMNGGMKDRYLAVLVFTAGVLSQEITVLQAIPILICVLLFAGNRRWPDEVRLLVASACAVGVVLLDVAFHLIKCLTPLEGVSPRVEAKVGWCVEKIANFFTLFISYSRLHLFLSAFMVVGFVQALRRKQTVATCLYLYLFVSVIVINLLITSKGYRYQYYLIPLWIILSVHGVAECARLIMPAWKQMPVRMALAGGWLGLALCSFAPWRLLNCYDASLGGNPTQPLAYVRDNFRPGDRLAITEPYPDAAYVETGRCDYDISIPILYDFSYRRGGHLVDRNGGGDVIANLDELQRAFAKTDRLWIVFDRYTLHARGEKILWEYPAARVQLFLQNNCKLVYRSYLWSVYLWDRKDGHYSTFREKPNDWFE
jgi:Dolichyl-phosphate-mannose-protein mannosyltransferase